MESGSPDAQSKKLAKHARDSARDLGRCSPARVGYYEQGGDTRQHDDKSRDDGDT